MRRFVWILLIGLMVMPTIGVSAQSSICPPALIESANTLISQARTALANNQPETAEALLIAAQELLIPCYDATFQTPLPPTLTPTIPASPSATAVMPPTPAMRFPTSDAVPSNQAVNTVITRFGGETDDIRGVDFSPNGFYAIGSSFDSHIYMYDVETFERVRRFSGHTDWVFNVDFTRDGALMASASADDTVRVWDVATATTITILRDHTQNVTNVAFSPDASLLVSTGQDNRVIVYDTRTWRKTATLDAHTDWVWDVAFSPDGRQFVTVSGDATAIIWDATTLTPVKTLQGHQGVVIGVDWSPDGKYILTGSHDNTAMLWDSLTGEVVRVFRGVDERAVMDVVFSADSRLIAVASFAGYVSVWQIDGTPINTYTGHNGKGVWAVQFSPDGSRFLSGADDGGMLLHRLR